MTSFLRNRRTPKIWNPREQSTKLTINQIEADEIISVITNSQQFQQQTSSGVPQNVATTTYVDNSVNNSATNIRNSILGGASQAYDTLKELQTELENNDSAITSITNVLSQKANTSDLNNYYTKTQSDTSNTNLQNQINTNTSNITSNTNSINSLNTSVNSLNTSVNSLNSKTNNINVNGSTTTISSRLTVTGGSNGVITLGDQSTDTVNINGIVNFSASGSVNGLNKNHVGLSNVDNVSDLNKPISTFQQSALDLKANLSQILYQNTWYVNAGINLLSTVLNSIGTSQSQCILLSAGQINEPSPLTITQTNLTISGIDSAFASPSTLINNNITLSGSTMTRCRVSNVGFIENFEISGTQGRHTFKGVVFQKNMTISGITTNFINFYYCSFSGQVNIPNTFGGYVVFYFCNFSGATLNFNNLSNQQIYINSCVNLPSFNLNALLNGFNTTTTTTSINTVSLNCSGSVSLVDGSISQSSVNGLTTSLAGKLNITDAQSTYATISNLNTTNTNVSDLQAKTNTITYDSGSDTLTINSKLSVQKDNTTNNSTINLGDGLGTDVINIKSNIVANNLTITPTQLSFVSGASSSIQSQLNSRITTNTTQNVSGLKNFTGGIQINGTDLNTRISAIETTNTNQDASISSINTSITNLENNKANITYVNSQIANLVNSAPESLNQLNELASALGNNPNYATDMVNALALKSNDNVVVKLSGNQEITGTKNFTGSIELSGVNLNTRISDIESVNNTQNTNISNLQQKTNAINYNASTDTLSISSKLDIQKDLSNVASVYLGDNVGNDVIYLRGNLNVLGTINLTQTELSRLSGVSSGIQSQLNSRITTNTTQNVSGLKNFTGGIQINGTDLSTTISDIQTKNTSQDTSITSINSSITDLQNNKQNNLVFDNTPTSSSGNSLTSGTIFTALQSYLLNSTASSTYQTISGMSSYLTSSTASSTYQTISGMSSYLTSSTASSTYQTISGMSSYFGLSSNNSISGRNTFTNMNTFNRVCESVYQAGSGTNLSLDFSTLTAGIIFYAPSANYTLSLTNIPTTNTNCIITLTLRYSTKFYANALNINGSAITMTAIGGASNLSTAINASSTLVYQSIQIVFNNTSTPTATTALLSIF